MNECMKAREKLDVLLGKLQTAISKEEFIEYFSEALTGLCELGTCRADALCLNLKYTPFKGCLELVKDLTLEQRIQRVGEELNNCLSSVLEETYAYVQQVRKILYILKRSEDKEMLELRKVLDQQCYEWSSGYRSDSQVLYWSAGDDRADCEEDEDEAIKFANGVASIIWDLVDRSAPNFDEEILGIELMKFRDAGIELDEAEEALAENKARLKNCMEYGLLRINSMISGYSGSSAVLNIYKRFYDRIQKHTLAIAKLLARYAEMHSARNLF